MSDIIRQLPDSVANQIAAGEVVQRPASVVKELVENSIDAGASEVNIIIKDAGKTLIQVVDNGKGMSPTDARMAFERHATSKISTAKDLFALHTMGFRGEALPSICAISTVEMKTMAEDSDLGTRLVITASKKESQEAAVCAKGCNIAVKNLFFNVPARRKFLKSDSVELTNIMREFERLALVNHDVRMSIDTGSRQIELRPGSFKQRIGDIWKNNLNMQLLPIDVETSVAKITGFVCRPEFARRRNPLQFLIVNGRNMQHPYFRKAIESAYEGLIATDTRPCFFLKFEVDPETIDVNIHPTKQEIKFENEQTIWAILKAAVKSTLGKFSAGPSIDFTTDALPIEPARPGDFVARPTQGVDKNFNPFRSSGDFNPFSSQTQGSGTSFSRSGNRHETKIDKNWDRLYADFMNASKEEDKSIQKESPNLFTESKENSEIPLCFQCGAKYIITPSRDGLLVIDQYRAHVKILFEHYLNMAKNVGLEGASQRMIFPESLSIDIAQESVMEQILPDLRKLGFMIEQTGEKWQIEGVPTFLPSNQSPRELIENILSSVAYDDKWDNRADITDSEEMFRQLALVAARSSAIRRGRVLTTTEMEQLLGELLSMPDPQYTPSGNRIMHTVTLHDLNDLLK